MKKVSITNLAEFVGVSVSHLSEIRHGKKRFSSRKARDISIKTRIPLEHVLFGEGNEIYQALLLAYSLTRNLPSEGNGGEREPAE